MQLYALDERDEEVYAGKAVKRCDYRCMECGDQVRLRGGLHRQAHFFHMRTSPNCKLSAKGEKHIQVQKFLQASFTEGDLVLEKRFPSIGRIADAVYLPEKIIFEVQCSPIAAEEIEARNRDYGLIGYQVIWILHDSLYNRFRLSAAEIALDYHPHYFTNIDPLGRGFIYDQYGIGRHHVRKKRLEKMAVSVQGVKRVAEIPLLPRRAGWKTYIQGDLIDRCATDELFLKRLMEAEERVYPLPPVVSGKLGLLAMLFNGYKIFFRILLERACR